jgi:4-amino-4-deoxy-L-arabinose transferase-like glycosyltransferase
MKRDWEPLLRRLAGIGGALLALLAGLWAQLRPVTADFGDLLWLWAIGVAWFLLAFVPRFSAKEVWLRLSHLVRSHRVELAGLAALLLVALAVRAFDLEHIPANLGGEEGIWAMEGLAMLDGRLTNPFFTRWATFPSMSFLAFGLSMRVFGDTVAGVRALSALLGVAAVLTTFVLVRELWGRRVAWLAAVSLTSGSFHLQYSRLAANNIADPFLVTLSLWLLVRGLRKTKAIYFALAGAVMGLGWYGYFGARLIGIIAAVYLAWRLVVERRFLHRYGRLLLVLLGAALVVVAPLMFHYLDYPEAFSTRFRQVNIFASGWLEREQVITGRSASSLLLQQFWKSISAFNYTLDPTFWIHDTIPLLDFVSGVLFIIGLLWATAYCRQPANGLLLLWFWLTLILGWVMTENPPSNPRVVIITPALAALVGLGLNWLTGLSRRAFGGGRRLWDRVVIVLFILVTVTNLHRYFVVYTPTRVYGNPTAEIATDLARYLKQQDDDYVVYFYAPPVMYWGFGTLRFMARGVEGWDVFPPGEGGPPDLDLTRGARFVFLPHRLDELEGVRAQVPGGVETPVYSTADRRLLYVLYEAEQ